jgi:putative hemolysin
MISLYLHHKIKQTDVMEANDKSKDKINIDEILDKKIPKIKKRIPRFLINYLKKILHEDEINHIFRTYGHLWGHDFAETVLRDHFNIRFNIIGEENIPEDPKVIFASNHPLGGADGIALIQVLTQHYKNLKVPVNDFLMYVDNLREFFIPISKIGGQAKNTGELINEACESDAAILFFPAGQCSRRQKDGSIKDNEWKKTFIKKAVQYHRNIIPLYFEGQNSKFFYNLAYFRSKLGIKLNIEMLFLSDELFKQKNKTFTVKIGKPIPYETFTKEKSDSEWAEWVKQKTYNL